MCIQRGLPKHCTINGKLAVDELWVHQLGVVVAQEAGKLRQFKQVLRMKKQREKRAGSSIGVWHGVVVGDFSVFGCSWFSEMARSTASEKEKKVS